MSTLKKQLIDLLGQAMHAHVCCPLDPASQCDAPSPLEQEYAQAAADALLDPTQETCLRLLPDPAAGCVCTPHYQDAGGGYTELLLEPEPACPEHSDHLYDPREGVWVPRPSETTSAATIPTEA